MKTLRMFKLLVSGAIVVNIAIAKPTVAASFSFEDVLGLNPEDILSDAQGKIEDQINDLIGPISELLAIDPNDFLDDALSDLNLPDLDISSIYGDMNIPDPNKLLEELQGTGTGDFTFGMQLGSSVEDNLLLLNEASVELTGKLAKAVASSSALGEDAQEKIKEKIEFGDETTQTSALMAAATQKLAEQGQTLVSEGESTDVTQDLERLQLEAMGLKLQAEATQSNQLSILSAQQAAMFAETQQNRIDNAYRNQILSDISTTLQGGNAGNRVEKSANIRALANGSQFSTFNEPE
ncbi:hypothetical protein [Okeania sp. SIO2B3]|uniref:hypothetical protein n=1 Tax=Okeania sp. SIO2B3 TaxID=2607784 RepID=UPI0013BF6111|nr:hypothetical protein [Okeania sp. SIO2B3]NET45984.1 hypothetical protein [Okeania sp. SIO2B3]